MITKEKEKPMEVKSDIELPSKKSAVERVNPSTLVLFGLPKCGKTTILSELEDCFIIDCEKGTEFLEVMKLKVPEEFGPVKKYEWVKSVARKIKEQGRPYKYVAIDTLSMIDEWAEWVGTYNYMNSTIGSSFNREKDMTGKPIKGGKKLKPSDPDYESVHTIGEGYGYRWSREAMMDMYNELSDLGSVCTIFVCHVADKLITSKLSNQEVRSRDLALTGKVRDIIARKVDAIGYVHNESGKLHISFKGNEERVGGIRSKHIIGYEGQLDWSKIFI